MIIEDDTYYFRSEGKRTNDMTILIPKIIFKKVNMKICINTTRKKNNRKNKERGEPHYQKLIGGIIIRYTIRILGKQKIESRLLITHIRQKVRICRFTIINNDLAKLIHKLTGNVWNINFF